MKKEKISKVIGELADRHIEDALYCEKNIFFEGWRRWKKTAACAALIAVCILSMTGIVFASNVKFREMIVTFISSFSEKEKEEIRNGHATTSLDRADVLIGFLHGFNDNNMGNGEKAKYGENGFDYIILETNEIVTNIIVTCESEELKLLVKMKEEEIEKGIKAWKIASYQFISCEEANKLLKIFPEESQIPANGEESGKTKNKPKDSVISASKQHGKIYNALHKEKENIITLATEETIEFKSIFESYKNDIIGWNGQEYNYVVLFDKVSYMITEDGFVIKKNKSGTSAFKIKSKDLKKVMNLFKQYKIRY